MKLVSQYLFTSVGITKAILFLFIVVGLSACSNSTNNNESNYTIDNQQRVESGTVVSVKKIQIQPEKIDSYGNVGVSASSGGFHGIYGSIDLGTLSRIFKNNKSTKTAQEIIVKKASGETVSITQALNENFKQGDAVKIVIRNGNALVIH